ncbi:hypothetical protein T07_4951, partial [Trichinella nelsoni]
MTAQEHLMLGIPLVMVVEPQNLSFCVKFPTLIGGIMIFKMILARLTTTSETV